MIEHFSEVAAVGGLGYALCGILMAIHARGEIDRQVQEEGFKTAPSGLYGFIAVCWPLVILGEIYGRLTGGVE